MNGNEENLALVSIDDFDAKSLHIGEVFYSERGSPFCVYGYRPVDMKADIFCYAVGVGFRDKTERTECRFIELRRGALVWAPRPSSRFGSIYHASNLMVALPSGTQNFFGVLHKDGGIHKEATTEAFGFEMEVLEKVIRAYCDVMGIHGYRVGRVTFSKTRDNVCDLTGAGIPREFPYVTFAESGCIWSHISLIGFYSHLAFLLKSGTRSRLYEELLAAGAKQEWLEWIRDIPTNIVGSQVGIERL